MVPKPVLSIYYRSDWNPAILHWTNLDPQGNENTWQDTQFETGESIGISGWNFVHLNDVSYGIRFVCCNFVKSQWDNPPDGTGTNYEIRVDPKRPCRIITLSHGVVNDVAGEPVALVTDLDGTLLGNQEALENFKRFWEAQHVWRGSLLIYSTGRNLKDCLKVCHDQNLPRPDYAICGVGTEIYTFPHNTAAHRKHSHLSRINIENLIQGGQSPESFAAELQDADLRCPTWCPSRFHAVIDVQWEQILGKSFNRLTAENKIKETLPEGIINGNWYHDPFRVSVSIKSENLFPIHLSIKQRVENLCEAFKEYIIFVSGGDEWKYLDITPMEGGKRNALEYVCFQQRRIPPRSVLVCGDSGNDMDMFTSSGVKGCCVGNAHPDLIAFLKQQVPNNDDPNYRESDLEQVTMALAKCRNLKVIEEIHFSSKDHADAILESLAVFQFDDPNLIKDRLG